MEDIQATVTELAETVQELIEATAVEKEDLDIERLSSIASKAIALSVLGMLDLQKSSIGDPAKELADFKKMLKLAERVPKKYRAPFLDLWAGFSENSFAEAYRLGRKHGEQELHSKNQRRATDGRRLIGATSRDKVRKASSDFRHLSKESAAPLIAEVVRLSPATVRRYLSEMYPSDKWN